MASFIMSPVRRDESEIPESDEIRKEKALIDAAARGETDELLEMLESGVSVEAEAFNESQLHTLKNTATPLQSASGKGYPECVQILIDYGANVSAADCTGMTPLHFAAEKGHVECIQKLLQAGAVCSSGTFVEPKYKPYFGKPYANGTTALHIAVAYNHVDCAKMLISYKADYNAVDEWRRTSLYIAAFSGYTQCVLAHLDIHHHQPLRFLPSFPGGNTPLHFAVKYGMAECVLKLVILGSDANHINSFGLSPLHLALSSTMINSMEILKLLVLKGYKTDVNLANHEGYIPLDYVCFNDDTWGARRRPEMAKFLISYGADVNMSIQGGLELVEYELNSRNTDYSLLKYMLRSMLHLPPLSRCRYSNKIRLAARIDRNREFNIFRSLRFNGAGFPHNNTENISWCNELTSQHRTLKHYCRYAIRKRLGAHGLARIEQLHLPTLLIRYVLLEF